jgi:hypothetical protein
VEDLKTLEKLQRTTEGNSGQVQSLAEQAVLDEAQRQSDQTVQHEVDAINQDVDNSLKPKARSKK